MSDEKRECCLAAVAEERALTIVYLDFLLGPDFAWNRATIAALQVVREAIERADHLATKDTDR